jgi:hypothetical protein
MGNFYLIERERQDSRITRAFDDACDCIENYGYRDQQLERNFMPVSACYTYIYLKDYLKRGTPEIEAVLKKSSHYAFFYARNFVKDRWIDGERSIFNGRNYSNIFQLYIDFLNSLKPTLDTKIKWLNQGNIDILFKVFEQMGMEKSVQDRIIQERPDLIDQIPNLDPELKKEYGYELNLARIEV